MRSIRLGSAAVLAATMVTTACTDTTGPGPGEQTATEQVTVQLGTSATSTTQVKAQPQGSSLVVSGTNGTLRIDALHVILDRFELKRVDDDGCAEEDHSCERFRAPPMLLDLPLDSSSSVIAVRQAVEPGTYRRLKFEIEDLNDDEDNALRASQIRELRTAIRARFADWPKDASMLVVGSFTPTGGEPVAFRTYFEAEIEVELQLAPPVTINDTTDGGTFTIDLDLSVLFRTDDGRVRNLGALDFGRTGRVQEFELEIEDGFSEIEFRR